MKLQAQFCITILVLPKASLCLQFRVSHYIKESRELVRSMSTQIMHASLCSVPIYRKLVKKIMHHLEKGRHVERHTQKIFAILIAIQYIRCMCSWIATGLVCGD